MSLVAESPALGDDPSVEATTAVGFIPTRLMVRLGAADRVDFGLQAAPTFGAVDSKQNPIRGKFDLALREQVSVAWIPGLFDEGEEPDDYMTSGDIELLAGANVTEDFSPILAMRFAAMGIHAAGESNWAAVPSAGLGFRLALGKAFTIQPEVGVRFVAFGDLGGRTRLEPSAIYLGTSYTFGETPEYRSLATPSP